MINILYSLLTCKVQDADLSGYYAKRRDFVLMNSRQKELVDKFMPADVSAHPRFACFICGKVPHTVYGGEILRLDPNNTYFQAPRDPGQCLNSQDACVFDCMPKASAAGAFRYLMDSDIAERLVVPTSVEIAAAVCLQLLREMLHA